MSLVAALFAALALVTVAGCGGAPAPKDPREALTTAKQTLDAASGVHLVVTGTGVPSGVDALLSADGTVTHQPAFTGKLEVRAKAGLDLSAEVVSVHDTVYAKPAFSPIWLRLDPATYGIPDPARLTDPTHGLTSLLPATANPVYGKRSRQGRQVLTEISGTLPAATLTPLFANVGASDTFAVVYRIDLGSHQLVSMHLSGPFYGRQICSYDVAFDAYGVAPSVAVPSGAPTS